MNEEEHLVWLEKLKNTGRIDHTGRVRLSDEEILLLVSLAENSSYFKGLLEQFREHGSLFAKAFVYLMEAFEENKNRQYAKLHSRALNDLPEEGETMTLQLCIATIKMIRWEQEENYYGRIKKNIRFNLGIIGYCGDIEVFFWGTSQKIQRANLEEKKCYLITGTIKAIKPAQRKMELTRIQLITPA